jgi:hypothetical protein
MALYALVLLTFSKKILQILDLDLIPWDQESDFIQPEGKCI